MDGRAWWATVHGVAKSQTLLKRLSSSSSSLNYFFIDPLFPNIATPEIRASQVVQIVKNLLANARDLSSIPGLGRSPREGNGNPLQYSSLETPLDRGACWATVHAVAKSWIQLSH